MLENRTSVEYRILGSVEVWHEGRPLPLGRPHVRALLAFLLLHANETVTAEQLTDALWLEAPPGARNTVQRHVSRLRAVLQPVAGGVLVTQPGSYRLDVQAGQLDLDRFRSAVQQAEQARSAGHLEQAATMLRDALALWHGPALAGVASDSLLQRAATRLEEMRLSALELRLEVDLELGRSAELVGELTELCGAHPFHERLVEQLMLSLYRTGRQAEALEVCRRARQTLNDELGIDPGPRLQALERRILKADPSLDPPRPRADVGDGGPAAAAAYMPAATPVPSELPTDINDLVGRVSELAFARRHLEPPAPHEAAPPIVVLTGPAGVGKTTLAVHIGHQLRACFPDGQLFVDLRGAEADPRSPADVLAGFLRAFGVNGLAIPADPAERAALFRARLIDRRCLVVLDNAAAEAQVRPLLPSAPGCATLVTSRSPLGGLGASSLELDVLDVDEAVELLARAAGSGRIAGEPAAARAIAELCGGLPLAVRIAGARLATRPRWKLGRLADRLADERRLLDELRVGDLEVRSSLALGYRGLDETARRAFRQLGLLNAPDFAVWLAAGLLGLAVPAAEEVLERLVDAHLLESGAEDGAGQVRYRFHSLVRAFARELLEREEPGPSRRLALERALATQLAMSARAHCVLSPSNAGQVRGGTAPHQLPEERSVIAALDRDPLGWFEAERATLVAGVEQACQVGRADFAWELACHLASFFGIRGYWLDWHATHEGAIEACRLAGHGHGELQAMQFLGTSHLWLGDPVPARSCFERCLVLAADQGDRQGEGAGLLGLGLVATYGGRTDQAEGLFARCLELFRRTGDRHGIAVAHVGIGEVRRFEGRLAEAAEALDVGVGMFRDVGDLHWEAIALLAQADLLRDTGQPAEAKACLVRSLGTFRHLANHHFAALVLYRLARLHREQDRVGEAIACLEKCMQSFRALGLQIWEARALNQLGKANAALGDCASAVPAWKAALAIFRAAGAPHARDVEAQLRECGA